jgi:hypothetical protein
MEALAQRVEELERERDEPVGSFRLTGTDV